MFLRPQWNFLDRFKGATLVFCSSKGGQLEVFGVT